jgi:ketosteroid isomerase-like protein
MAESPGSSAKSSPREVYERMKQRWLGHAAGFPNDLLAQDVIIEQPFSPQGTRRRIEGRAEWLAFVEASSAALPVRFEECRDIAVHETTDPEVIIVEYELAGTVTTTNRHASAAFIGMLRVRDGQIVHWREYQNVLAMAEALGRPPAQLDGISGQQHEPAPSGTGS